MYDLIELLNIIFLINEFSYFRSGPYTEETAEYIRNGGRYALATAVLDSIVLVFVSVIAFLLR
jgi:hypothetical protein